MNTLTATPATATWITTRDRDNVLAYVLPSGQIVARTPGARTWSLTSPGRDVTTGATKSEMTAWGETYALEQAMELTAMAALSTRLMTADSDADALGSWGVTAPAPVTATGGAPVIDWDAILAMGAREQEAALVKVTGIRADADLHGNVTGAEGRYERSYAFTDPVTMTALDSHVAARGTDVVSSVRDAVRVSAHIIPDGPDAMRTALVLSALMHGDVMSAAGKVVVTRLARVLTGEETPSGPTRRAVTEGLELAVGHVAGGALDHLDSTDRDADVHTLTHRLLATHDGRVVAVMDEHVHYVMADTGSDDRAESGWVVPATRADARARRADARPFGPYYARREPVAPAPLPVVTMGPHRAPRMAATRAVMIGSHVSRYVAATATAMTRGMGTGQGMGVDAYGNPARDALRRVSLSDGFTFSRERLSGPLTGGSWVDGPAPVVTESAAKRAARVERVAVVKVATSKRDALRARLAR